ncbi:hypothetical protein TTHERM_00630510 (macronuclear) [Tetrahymena thermophila SB210]|uniref:Uncharacterized protein n=1 Tax=Tetrahymena thermophila (strain SB210) TaxID=312017 RepID=Q241N9_TETTS|nr:hypothetical protein TTHERM_00630510 [Tetrahymena thermophila SB210]EAS02531.1 hypothetical protein TTHERM_00630510 [Tetrahymena thermophila SB210]|eukprot:XP_001022776.1 hypothetical protein TTHERM_00630510 [Tetrahymena thermophila SB210]
MNLSIQKVIQDKGDLINEKNTVCYLTIAFSKFNQVSLYYQKASSLFLLNASDQNGNFIQITQTAQKRIIQMLKQHILSGFQKKKDLEKQLSGLLSFDKYKSVLSLKKCFLQGGGNFLSNSNEELKQKKDQNIIEWLEEKEDEDQQKSCIYVKDCIKELNEMIAHMTELRSNTKTYSYQKFKNLNQAFFENPECHPLLLQFLELSADRLLFYMNQEKFIVTDNQKNEFIKLIDDQIQVLQSFQQHEPLQNHIFYFKLIRYIFTTSKSIETTSQLIVKSGQTLYQVLTVAYKLDKAALKQLIDKCKNACSSYRNCKKIVGIIQYNENILCQLEEKLSLNSFSTQSSFSSQDYSRKSTSASSYSDSMQNSFDQVKQQNAVQYELELQIRHENIDTKSNFRIQYYALMQIDKLIQKMKEDPGYQINQNNTYFYKFIKNNDNGIMSYSERQYFFRQLENFAFERNILLRYISLSILIRCYELFTKKCPNYPLLQEIIDAIYYRYYFEVHQKIYILISKNKDLLMQIKNKDSFEKQNQLKSIANQASVIILEQNNQNNNNYYADQLDFDQQSMSQQSQQEDLDMMRSRIDQIKNTQDSFLQSRIAWQNYIDQQYNLLQTHKTNFLDLFSTGNAVKPIQQTLLELYFRVREVSNKRAIIVQGASGSGKTQLSLHIHQILIEHNKKQIDSMLNQSKQSQSCIVSFGQKMIIYTPILLKLQNMNLTNKHELQNLFDSQLSEVMQNLEYKVLIIDGLNDQNYNNLSQILKNQIKDKKKFIFLITSTSNYQQVFLYNNCATKFLESLEIKIADVDGIQLEKLTTQIQMKQFIDIYNQNQEKSFNYETKQKFNNQKNYPTIQKDEMSKKLREAIIGCQDPLLMQTPLSLYQILTIYKQFQGAGIQKMQSQSEIFKKFFIAQFYGSFSYFQIEKSQIVKIFEKAYFFFFKKIVDYMQQQNQNFITLEAVQNNIINLLSQYLNNIYNTSYQNNHINDQEHFQDLKEYFINQLTNFYNKQIFEKLNSLVLLNNQQITESLTFKQESYFYYFLSYKLE